MSRPRLLAGLALLILGLFLFTVTASPTHAMEPTAPAPGPMAGAAADLTALDSDGPRRHRGGQCAAGAPELDPDWTAAGLVLLVGGAILVAGQRRRERKPA